MSARVIADPNEFARGRERMEGSFALAELDRLLDRLAAPHGCVTYRIEGGINARGEPIVACRTEVSVELVCQRCLGTMRLPLSTETELVLVTDPAKLQDDGPEEPDRVLATEPLDVQALIEDEILLALPMAPRHPESECAGVAMPLQEGPAGPFATLATWRPRNDE